MNHRHLNPITVFYDPSSSLCSWSGGKDSCFALCGQCNGYAPKVCWNGWTKKEEYPAPMESGNNLNGTVCRSRLAVYSISSSWEEYEQHFTAALIKLKKLPGHARHLWWHRSQAHRDWEKSMRGRRINRRITLWKQDRKQLVLQCWCRNRNHDRQCNEKWEQTLLAVSSPRKS